MYVLDISPTSYCDTEFYLAFGTLVLSLVSENLEYWGRD